MSVARVMRALPFALVCTAVLSACGGGGCGGLGDYAGYPTWGGDAGTCLYGPVRFGSFLEVGVENEVTFGLDEYWVPNLAELAIPKRTKAVVDIVDPSGTSVLHQELTPTRKKIENSHFQEVVTVKVTPDRPGTWTLTADFGKAAGQEGTTVQKAEAIRTRSDAAARVIAWKDVPTDCLGFGVTGRDTAFCVHGDSAEVTTSRGQRIPGTAFAAAGNALWRLTPAGTVERMEDDGAAFLPTHAAPGTFTAGALTATDREARLLGVAPEGMALVTFTVSTGSTLTASSTPVPLHKDAAGIALGQGATVVFTDTPPFKNSEYAYYGWNLAMAPDVGGRLEVAETGIAVGADPEVLWFTPHENIFRSVDLKAAWVEGGQLRTAALELPGVGYTQSPSPRLAKGAMAFYGAPLTATASAIGPPQDNPAKAFVVPRLEAGTISVERYNSGPDFAPVSAATAQHVFARALDGQSLKVFAR